VAGLLINEVSLRGIVKERNGFIALVQGPDKKTYAVRQGQRLFDGTVKSITEDTVVFSQDVNDPLSLVKQREVRKTLRSGEENRG
jgi:Tfp pilus assembly protein PilP